MSQIFTLSTCNRGFSKIIATFPRYNMNNWYISATLTDYKESHKHGTIMLKKTTFFAVVCYRLHHLHTSVKTATYNGPVHFLSLSLSLFLCAPGRGFACICTEVVGLKKHCSSVGVCCCLRYLSFLYHEGLKRENVKSLLYMNRTPGINISPISSCNVLVILLTKS